VESAGREEVSDNSAIEWTDATWNPVRGCVKVSPGCALFESPVRAVLGVVAGDELSRPPLFVVTLECGSATALTFNCRIWLVWFSAAIREARSVLHRMVFPRGNNLDVLRSVVGLVAILVVNLLAAEQQTPEYFRRDQPVLVNVTAHVRHRVTGSLDQDVAVRGDCSSALPERVFLAVMNDSHTA